MKLKIGDLVRMNYRGKEIPYKTNGIVLELLETIVDGTLNANGKASKRSRRTSAVKVYWGEYGTFWDTLDRLEKINK